MAKSSSKATRYRVLDFIADPGYRVGSDGSVWSRVGLVGYGGTRRGTYRVLKDCWKRLKGSRHYKNGYLSVMLVSKGKKKLISIHRLVLAAFVGPCPEGMQCRHLNGDRTDNRLENLRWGTVLENHQDMARHGRLHSGENHYATKLTKAQAQQIDGLYKSGQYNQYELAKLFDISQATVSNIVRCRKRWK